MMVGCPLGRDKALSHAHGIFSVCIASELQTARGYCYKRSIPIALVINCGTTISDTGSLNDCVAEGPLTSICFASTSPTSDTQQASVIMAFSFGFSGDDIDIEDSENINDGLDMSASNGINASLPELVPAGKHDMDEWVRLLPFHMNPRRLYCSALAAV